MPAPPYASVRVSLNGGSNTSGGIEAAVGDVVQLSADPSGLPGVTQQKWELYDFPEGYALPAGWTEDAAGVYYSTAVTPPTFTLSIWGSYPVRLTLNDGKRTVVVSGTLDQVADSDLVDEATVLSVPSPTGIAEPFEQETDQFGRSWLARHKRNIRALEAKSARFSVTEPQFGAKGDGINDDTAAIQAAIDAAIAASASSLILGGEVGQITLYFPPGLYRITGQLRFTRARGLRIEGAGRWATILRWDGSLSTSPIALVTATNGGGEITYETAEDHGLSVGNIALVQGIDGTNYKTQYHQGNRRGLVTRVDDTTHFTLAATVGDTYGSGGKVWTPAAGIDAMLLFYNCRECLVDGFSVRVESTETNPPFALIECRGDFSDPNLSGFVPTQMEWSDLWLTQGSIGLLYSYAAGSANNNNDRATFWRVAAENQTLANFAFGVGPGGSAGSNMKVNRFFGCQAIGGRYGVMKWGGAFVWHNGYMRDHRTTSTTLTSGAVGATVLAVASSAALTAGRACVVQDSTGNRTLTSIVSVDSAIQITVADAVTAASGSVVYDDYGDNWADFTSASTDNGTDVCKVDSAYCEASAHLYVDRFDVGTVGALPLPFKFSDVAYPNSRPGTDNYAVIFRRSHQSVVGGTFGDLSFPPARFYCAASASKASRFKIRDLKLFGSPLLGGGINASNTEHLVTSGWAIVDDGGHTTGDGTSNPTAKEDRPARLVKVATTDDLRAVIPPRRFEGDVVVVASRKGRGMVWDSAAGVGAWDDDEVQVRPSDLTSADAGMWFAAGERTFAADIDHLRKVNAGHHSYADLGAGTDPLDLVGGPYGWDAANTEPDDGFLVVAPAINDIVAGAAENSIYATGWTRTNLANNPSAPNTLQDTVDGGATAHSATYTFTNLDSTGTVLTEFCLDCRAVGGSPIHRLQVVNSGVWSHIIDVATGTKTGSGLDVGADPEFVQTTTPGTYRMRWRCYPTSKLLTIYLASNTGLGTNSYTGDGTGKVDILRAMASQKRTAAGRFMRQGVLGTRGGPLPDADTNITFGAGANRVDPKAWKTANRSTTVDPTGSVAGQRLVVYVRDRGSYTRAFVNGGPGGGTLFTTTAGQPVVLAFTSKGPGVDLDPPAMELL